MKNFLLTICYFISITYTIGQIQGYNTRILYQENKECYFFNLSNNNQTLYFDSVIYDNNRPISILIENDLEDTVFLKIKSLQSDKQKFTEKSTRYLLPNEHYVITPEFNSNRFDKQSLLNSFFECYYNSTSTSTDQYFIFRMTGNIELDSLPNFKESLYADLDLRIAKKTAPRSLNTLVIRDASNTNTETLNDLPLEKSDSIKELFYYNWSEKQFIKPNRIGLYTYHVFKRDLESTGLYLDSIKSILISKNLYPGFSKPTASILTSEDNYYYTFKSTPENVLKIKSALNGVKIHLTIRMGSNPTYLDDSYLVFFSEDLNWNEREVETFLKEKEITSYEYIPKAKVTFPKNYSYLVKIKLGNDQASNLKLIESLIDSKKVAWISSGRQSYSCKD